MTLDYTQTYVEDEHNNAESYLSFRLGDETFGAHVNKVLNILEMIKVTKVPNAPEYMKGVINLRGKVLPVIDTRVKFHMKPAKITQNTCIIVMDINIDNNTIQLGAMVDSVIEVLEVEADKIMPPPSIGTQYKSNVIYGMISKGEDFIMLLDVDKIFSANDILNMAESSNIEL